MMLTAKPQIVLFICFAGLIAMVSCQSFSCRNEQACQGNELEDLAGTGPPTPVAGDIGINELQIIDDYAQNGTAAKLWFQHHSGFIPIGFVQIVRTVDLHNPDHFLYPSEEKQERATEDGWYVDRGEGYDLVTYGRMNNGSFADYVFVGSQEDSRAYLKDAPYRPENQPNFCILWQAVSVPVCIVTTEHPEVTCEGDRFGYYYWSWLVDHDGSVVVKDDGHGIARQSISENLDEALEKWRDQKGSIRY